MWTETRLPIDEILDASPRLLAAVIGLRWARRSHAAAEAARRAHTVDMRQADRMKQALRGVT